MEKEFSNEFIKHKFSEIEKQEIAIEMAQKVANLQQAEDDKKAVMSDYKSQIDGIQAGINGAAAKLNNGYEMRTIKCEVWSRTGIKRCGNIGGRIPAKKQKKKP